MSDFANDGEAARWNFRPPHPVALNPLFQWPPRPGPVLRWYRGAWLPMTSLTVCFGVAVLVYVLFLPPLEQMQY